MTATLRPGVTAPSKPAQPQLSTDQAEHFAASLRPSWEAPDSGWDAEEPPLTFEGLRDAAGGTQPMAAIPEAVAAETIADEHARAESHDAVPVRVSRPPAEPPAQSVIVEPDPRPAPRSQHPAPAVAAPRGYVVDDPPISIKKSNGPLFVALGGAAVVLVGIVAFLATRGSEAHSAATPVQTAIQSPPRDIPIPPPEPAVAATAAIETAAKPTPPPEVRPVATAPSLPPQPERVEPPSRPERVEPARPAPPPAPVAKIDPPPQRPAPPPLPPPVAPAPKPAGKSGGIVRDVPF